MGKYGNQICGCCLSWTHGDETIIVVPKGIKNGLHREICDRIFICTSCHQEKLIPLLQHEVCLHVYSNPNVLVIARENDEEALYRICPLCFRNHIKPVLNAKRELKEETESV